MPPRKALGSSTELSTSVMARIGPVISFIALMVARARAGLVRQRSMFSSTTMASSTTMPIARTNRISQVVEREAHQLHDSKVPTSDTATSITGRTGPSSLAKTPG